MFFFHIIKYLCISVCCIFSSAKITNFYLKTVLCNYTRVCWVPVTIIVKIIHQLRNIRMFFNGNIHVVLKMRLSIEKKLILKYFVATKMSQISNGNYEYINFESHFKLRMVQLEILVVVIINTIKHFVDQLRY